MNDVATYRVNWEPKHANLRSLATGLNLGLDSFIFLDDSAAECNEIELHCPEVFSICLPANTARVPQYFRHLWIFDRSRVTAEDKERNSFYQENAKREQQHSQASSLGDYIASLELKIEIEIPADSMIARLSQLSQRTNQFNNTATRYTEADLVSLINDRAGYCRYTNVSDRFGDYGIVGLVTGNFVDDKLVLHAFLHELPSHEPRRGISHGQDAGKCAVDRGAKWVEIAFIPTARNKPIANFLNALPVESKVETDKYDALPFVGRQGRQPRIQADATAAGDSEENGRRRRPKKRARSRLMHRKVRESLLEIARELDTPKKILKRVKQHNKREASGVQSYVAPSNPVEEKSADSSPDILNLDQVSVEDSFFDLGGFSLLRLCSVRKSPAPSRSPAISTQFPI